MISHDCHYRNCETPCDPAKLPDIREMECPIMEPMQRVLRCLKQMDRNELAAHISECHPEYHHDPEPYFDAERKERFA